MIYLKEPNTNRIVEFQSEASIGAGFANWTRLTESEILTYELEQAKTSKLTQLKKNRDDAISSSTPKVGSTQVYEIDGIDRTFQLRVSDISTVNSRIIRLQNAPQGTTAQWTDIEGERLNLTLEQFKSLANHLDVRDQAIYELYNERKKEIQACETLEELENININF